MSLTNYEAEADLIGGLLVNNSIASDIADLIAPADFALDLHARMFEVILNETARGRNITGVGLKSFFEDDDQLKAVGGVSYIARMTGNPACIMYNAAFDTARLLSEIAERRRMQAGLKTSADACEDLTVPLGEIVAHADTAIAMDRGDGIHQPTVGEAFDELLASYEQKATGVRCQVIPEIDELLGPMRPKQLVVMAGRPGMGKTAVALSYCLGAAEAGHGILFVSLEMSSPELAARMASDLCFDGRQGVYYSNIRDGDLTPGQMLMVRKAQAKAHQLPIQVVDAGSLTMGKLNRLVRRHARRMAADGYKLELVVVDYLQLLHPDRKNASAYESVSEVSRGLKAMAKDNDVAVMALAQLSRSVESRTDKRPQLSDLRDSGQIEQDADAVLFLLRPEYYHKQAEPEKTDAKWQAWKSEMDEMQGVIEFILAKRRNGETGTASGAFHGSYQAVRGAE